MTNEDKLRFEVGEGFNILSQEELDSLEDIYEEILREKEIEYGYSGDSPYYEATEEFMYNISDKFSDEPEKFIQIIINHSDYSTFGWALHEIEDSEIYKYAYDKFFSIVREEDEDDEDYIKELLEDEDLPG